MIQLQDTDAGAEVIHMAENGFCADGEQEKLVADGATEITGPMPINTDGGLIANGEPIGASGLRQVHELVLQLRGRPATARSPATPASATPRCTARRAPPPSRSSPGSATRPDRRLTGLDGARCGRPSTSLAQQAVLVSRGAGGQTLGERLTVREPAELAERLQVLQPRSANLAPGDPG